RWYACQRTLDSKELYQREAGIEFADDGTWHLIRVTDDGKFTPQLGIDNEGRWGEKYENFTGYFQVDWTGAPQTNGMELTAFPSEPGPPRRPTPNYIPHEPTWLVPIAITPR